MEHLTKLLRDSYDLQEKEPEKSAYWHLQQLRSEIKQLALHDVVSSAKNKEAIISEMKTMTDDERLDIITEFCKYCGDLDSGCQCWNDE